MKVRLKTELIRKVFAILLVISMTVSQTGGVFAAETAPPSDTGQNVETPAAAESGQTESGTEADENADKTVSGAEAPAADPAENEFNAPDDADSLSENEQKSEGPNGEEFAVSENEMAQSEDKALSYGITGMPEGFSLTEEQLQGKKNITEKNVTEVLGNLTPGVDYAEDEVMFACKDPEYAQTVAEAYGGILESCEFGVAVIKLDTSKITVKEAVGAGADIQNTLPPVDAISFIKLTDPVPEKNDSFSGLSESAGVMSGKKNAVNERDWNYWRKQFSDPALDPGRLFKDDSSGSSKSMYQWMHDAVGSYKAWGVTQGEGVTVAVLDTGVYADHPDLKGQVSEVVTSVSPNFIDYNGHGTHVAGIVAAAANTVGGVGIAPKAKILGLPIFSGGGVSDEYIAKGINYVDNNGNPRAEVINMSLGGPVYNNTVQQAINEAHKHGVIICVALGNDGTNSMLYPAECDNVIGVASMDETGQRSDFSNYGSWADIAAPGSQIFSCWNGHEKVEKHIASDYDYWASWDGTSMATPVVAGVCALYISALKASGEMPAADKIADQVESVMKKTATKVPGASGIGAGMVNAAAMLATLEETGKPEIVAPAALTEGSTVTFKDGGNKGGTLGYIYTVNGKKPSAASGKIKEGFYVEASNGTASVPALDLLNNGLVMNGAAKLKVLRITGLGTVTDVAEAGITFEGSSSTGMIITGPSVIAKSKSLTFKLNRNLPKNSVTWGLEGEPDGVTINKTSGKVSTKKTSEGSFTVTATIGTETVKKTVQLVDAVTRINLKPGTDIVTGDEVFIPVFDSNGNLKSARLFKVDTHLNTKTENVIQLYGSTDNALVPVEFISSKPSVASVDATGKVTAKKAGSTKITCRAVDGSNKQACVNIKVAVPVSKLDIIAKGNQASVAYGKSMKLRTAVGSSYGTPSNKKIVWDKYPVRVVAHNNATGRDDDITEMVSSNKLINISNGTLRVDKRILKFGEDAAKNRGEEFSGYRNLWITVKASAADGSGTYCEKDFYGTTPTEFIGFYDPGKDYPNANPFSYYGGGDYGFYFKTDSLLYPVVTGSNPKIASAKLTDFDRTNGILGMVVVNRKDRDEKPAGTGKVTYTIKASDGTGKKCSLAIDYRIDKKKEREEYIYINGKLKYKVYIDVDGKPKYREY